jgi:hypothetical protein
MRRTKAQRMAELAEKEATRIHRHNRAQPLVQTGARVTESSWAYLTGLAREKRQSIGKTLTQVIEFYRSQRQP